jgi:dihydroneopterin aldolase / 2-amino-4-hydroxy-6-hydroxymethyldihydropteridine diphosphokinase
VAHDRIRLTRIRAIGYHGVFDDERRDGQPFVADVLLHVDTRDAAAGDQLDQTVDYGQLAQEVEAVLTGPPARLIETVAERIAAAALGHSVVDAVDVVVHKPQAPIGVPVSDVTVEVHRSRTHPPVVAATPPVPAEAEPTEASLPAPIVEPTEPSLPAPIAEPAEPSPPAPVVEPVAAPPVASIDEPVTEDTLDTLVAAVTPATKPAWSPVRVDPEPAAESSASASVLPASGPLGEPAASTGPVPVPPDPIAPPVAGPPIPPPPAPAPMPPAPAPVSAVPAPAPAMNIPPMHSWPEPAALAAAQRDHPPSAGLHRADSVPEPDVTADDPRLDAAPDQPVDVVLALGSNLGPSQDILAAAIDQLADTEGISVTQVAPLARTAPVGGPAQSDFLNTVLLAQTTLSPRDLLRVCARVESSAGRQRGTANGPRTLDVDIITYGTLLVASDDLELPHPRAHERAFVLVPWTQVDPDAELPGLGGGPVAALAATAPDRDGIRWLALDWWPAPES